MFDGSNYPKSLEEEQFEEWLEKGRLSKIGYAYLLIVWDALEEAYLPVYIEDRDMIESYELYPYASNQEALIAVYDLYSEARITIPVS
ncbi:hypothetical protein [Reichenbachiella sp.]|uniref:hypothetical protein n=1 Tax=Reichenbachiella sp. TaxID=2184521 RepID=UPI003B591EFB